VQKPERQRAARMAPELRKELILDAATALILRHQSSNFSLDDIAHEAKVSRPLVHRYFSSRDVVFQELLQREFDRIIGRQKGLVPDETPTEEAHKIYLTRNLEYLQERGLFLQLLMNEGRAAGGKSAEMVEQFSKGNLAYWVKRTTARYGISPHLARLGMMMTIAALPGAEGSLRLNKVTTDQAAEFWSTFILAGWEAVGKKFAETEGDPTA